MIHQYKFPMTVSEEVHAYPYFSWRPRFVKVRDYQEFAWWRLRVIRRGAGSPWLVQIADSLVRPPVYTTLFGRRRIL